MPQPCNIEELCDKQILDDCNQNPYSSIIQESDNVYRNITGEEVLSNTHFVEKKNVSALNFEDEFFRLKDEASARYFEDNVDDTLDQANTTFTDEDVTYVTQEDSKDFFDRILSMDADAVLSEEEKKRISIVREEKKEEEKVIKRNTWFNFMPAKEKPEGMFGSYNSDQIYSSMVFDLLSRNTEEVYKYEKDDLFLNEVCFCKSNQWQEILKHTKMPEPVQAPSIPLYPKFEEYAKWVTFAVNRNSHYSMEEKQKVVDILARLGSLDSEMDESPKTEFKEKKYL